MKRVLGGKSMEGGTEKSGQGRCQAGTHDSKPRDVRIPSRSVQNGTNGLDTLDNFIMAEDFLAHRVYLLRLVSAPICPDTVLVAARAILVAPPRGVASR